MNSINVIELGNFYAWMIANKAVPAVQAVYPDNDAIWQVCLSVLFQLNINIGNIYRTTQRQSIALALPLMPAVHLRKGFLITSRQPSVPTFGPLNK